MFSNNLIKSVDWYLFSIVLVIILLGLMTMYPAVGENPDIFYKQIVFSVMALLIIPVFANIDYHFLNGKNISFFLYIVSIVVLIFLLLFAPEINNANSWFIFFGLSIQPVDFIKILLIIVLARYFATRHIHINHLGTVVTSIVIIAIPVFLVYLQPDLGSSVVLMFIWFAIILSSGISKRYLLGLFLLSLLVSIFAWFFFLQDFQKDRIISFINPTTDLTGIGYNAFQSKVAIGSGEILGKGVAEGTQSKLLFLPEYQSDFIFAAFAEEWGFIGVVLFFGLFLILMFRLLYFATHGKTNFETLFTVGVVSVFFAHFFIHIGAHTGLLPVTGITLPFTSHGGSHFISEAIMIGMAMSMYKQRRWSRKDDIDKEISSSI